MNSSKVLCLISLTLRSISGILGVTFIILKVFVCKLCITLLWLSWSYSYTLCTGNHFEPAPSLRKKYYNPSKVRLCTCVFSTRQDCIQSKWAFSTNQNFERLTQVLLVFFYKPYKQYKFKTSVYFWRIIYIQHRSVMI